MYQPLKIDLPFQEIILQWCISTQVFMNVWRKFSRLIWKQHVEKCQWKLKFYNTCFEKDMERWSEIAIKEVKLEFWKYKVYIVLKHISKCIQLYVGMPWKVKIENNMFVAFPDWNNATASVVINYLKGSNRLR